MIGRIESVDFGTLEYQGHIYIKKPNQAKLVKMPFMLPMSIKETLPQITCPKELPKPSK